MDKRFKLTIITLIALTAINSSVVNAEITTQEAKEADYIINHGHSKDMAELMNLKQKQIMGVDTERQESKVLPIKWLKRLQTYIDPGVDDGKFGSPKESSLLSTGKKKESL